MYTHTVSILYVLHYNSKNNDSMLICFKYNYHLLKTKQEKWKSRDNNHCNCLEHQKTNQVKLDCVIAVHRYNMSMFVENMEASVYNCI